MVDTIHSKINYIIGHGKTKDAKMIPSQAGYGAGNGRREKNKRTTPGIPTWSPTVVPTWPDSA